MRVRWGACATKSSLPVLGGGFALDRARQALAAPATLLAVLTLAACRGTVGTSGSAAPAGAVRGPSPGLTGAAGTSVPAAAPGSSATRTATATRAPSPGARPARPTTAPPAPPAPPATTAAPTVAPAAGPGGAVGAITGAGFAPGVTLHAVGRNPEREFVLNRPVATAPDGTMRLAFDAPGRAPGVYTLSIGVDMLAAIGVRSGALRARGAFTIAEWGPAPTLTLEPDRGPCAADGPAIVARGRNFPPATSLSLYVGGGARRAGAGRQLIGTDGCVGSLFVLACTAESIFESRWPHPVVTLGYERCGLASPRLVGGSGGGAGGTAGHRCPLPDRDDASGTQPTSRRASLPA
jgi:hypothetical protein